MSLLSKQQRIEVSDSLKIYYQNKRYLGTPKLLFQELLGGKEDGPSFVLEGVKSKVFINHLKSSLPRSAKKTEWHLSGQIETIKSDAHYFIGPNVDLSQVPKADLQTLIQRKSIFLTPSSWVNPTLIDKYGISPELIKVWPSGLEMKRHKIMPKKKNVLIYEKYRRLKPLLKSELDDLVDSLESLGYKAEYLCYGKYKQKDFINKAAESSFAIWLGETESQGIALLQCWMLGTPTLARKVQTYVDSGREYEASSAPYMMDPLGKFFNGRIPDSETIVEFISNINSQKCQEKAIQDFSLESAAKSIYEIIAGVVR